MANIDELVWKTPKGKTYQITKIIIGETNVDITKYDEDSFLLVSGENNKEANLSQLETILLDDDITWGDEILATMPANDAMPEKEVIVTTSESDFVSEEDKAIDAIGDWLTTSFWKSIEGIGEMVLEIPHLMYPGCVLRIIKLDDDSFKVAVIGLPPNDGDNIRYEELDVKYAISNYMNAIGLSEVIAFEYFEKMKNTAEQTDYEIVPDEVPSID